tara:strand:- start:1705 stop:2025 length:321 start_codon:yes stop_codon:yes gene_type:complete
MFKKTTYFLILIFFVTSCADSWDSVKRGLTGEKRNTADEFLIKKKDPLILPPDFENLPEPGESSVARSQTSIEEKLKKQAIEDNTPSTSTSSKSVEESILKQIRKK